ncbi:beta-ketoacyl synthase N-terminal-like domain-containing protein [Capnocytophaga sp. G2]|uniref:beta-ketoacyl synthase N-terminal-like domain-containing protein n=1 Tax=Capnocytophaga sp. G2 TaxID=3110695 RepID=UPI002B49A70F|nr:beta-ketoacyl synthase N-terminal-like domain-containing protein [Capnocytophaga sp. G2]MEB3003919.1 beta-ketoacyl synthase N-terminal-like domain-containing protein [Capnocytophaga sp. G2]
MSFIHSYNCVTPLGITVQDSVEALLEGRTGIQFFHHFGRISDIYLAKVSTEKVEEYFPYISSTEKWSWLEKMLLLAIVPILSTIRITEKTAFILSTTKGNISQLNSQMEKGSLPYLTKIAKKIASFIGVKTEPIIVSNACVSGVMALSLADRLLRMGIYENALVVAGDEISEFVLSGFQSFQAISSKPCCPYDKERDGITLGEATAAAFLTIEEQGKNIQIIGSSSINDANHISGPSRTGEGLFLSVQNALCDAYIEVSQLDLINAHGTGTLYNDEMEAIAFSRLGLQGVPLNSYKGYFGHTLAAAGLLETILSVELAQQGTMIKSEGFNTLGVSFPLNIIRKTQKATVKYLLKTASGFGGSNTAIIVKIGD